MRNYFLFDDIIDAAQFAKDINKLITDYGCTTFGHVKEYYGIEPEMIKDIDYCKYIEKPVMAHNYTPKCIPTYTKPIIRSGIDKPVRYVRCEVLFNRYFNGEDQYPDYDADGNLIEHHNYIQDDRGVEMLAAAILWRTAVDMRKDRNQGCWEGDWFRELVINDDINPLVLRDQINANIKEYGEWKAPSEDAVFI